MDNETTPHLPLELARADEFRRLLSTITIDGAGGMEAYAHEDCERFIRSVQMIPAGVTSVLEIGGNPYFTTLLMKWFRPEIEVTCTNFFGRDWSAKSQKIEIDMPAGERETYHIAFENCNVEEDRLPDGPFDCVLFCEVLEHMTNDPLHPLREINRVLKDGGHLVLTTPNVARLENVARLMGGHNLYDPYSAYGPYGRHNREYTKHELNEVLIHCGFAPETLQTHDVHQNRAEDYFPNAKQLMPLLQFREADLGQYHFTHSVKARNPAIGRPAWLYRSYPAEDLV